MTSPIPSNYDQILNVLKEWGQSGLIPDTKVIKSYHPPYADPITGVTVLIPATVYSTKESTKEIEFDTGQEGVKVKAKIVDHKYVPLKDLPNAPYAGSNIEDWNIGHPEVPGALIPKTSTAIQKINYGSFYQQAAVTSFSQEEYEQNIKIFKFKATAERSIKGLDVDEAPKITDKLEDAKNFYATERQNTGLTSSYTIRPDRNYEMFATKVPCATPGAINCYIGAYEEVKDTNASKFVSLRLPKVEVTYIPDELKSKFEWEETFIADGSTAVFEIKNRTDYINALVVSNGGTEVTNGFTFEPVIVAHAREPFEYDTGFVNLIFESPPVAGAEIKVKLDTTRTAFEFYTYDYYNTELKAYRDYKP